MKFTVPGEPIPWARAKRAKSGHSYTDPKRAEYANLVSLAWATRCGEKAEGPLRATLTFYLARPKSHLRAGGTLKPGSPRRPSVKPDLDNLVKLILDALEGGPFLHDAQIVELVAHKRYGQPRAVIEIEEV